MSYREAEDGLPLVVSAGTVVSAFDRATGRSLWKNTEASQAAGGALVVTPTRVYVAGFRQAAALDAATGKTIWKNDSAAERRPALLLDGDRLFVASERSIECFALDGTVVWSHEIGRSVAIAIGDRTVYEDREG